MGEGLKQRYDGVHPPRDEDDEELFESDSLSTISDDEVDDFAEEDATSSSLNYSSLPQKLSSSNGPLYELSSLMEQLPIKRGLSKYYQGKSQSFTSLAVVSSIEDLPKKETPYMRKMKACRSYAGGMNDAVQKSTAAPAASKKSPRVASCASLMSKSSSSSLLYSSRSPPPIPVQKTPCPH